MIATLTGRFAEAEKLASVALELGRRAQEENAPHTFGVQMFLILWLRGEFEDAIALAERMVARYPPYFVGWKYSLAFLYAECGRTAEARRELDPLAKAGDLGAFHASFALLFGTWLAETCALLGDARWAASLYESLLPSAGSRPSLPATRPPPTSRRIGGTCIVSGTAARPTFSTQASRSTSYKTTSDIETSSSSLVYARVSDRRRSKTISRLERSRPV